MYCLSTNHLMKKQLEKSSVQFLIRQMLLRNPGEIKLELLLAYPDEAFHHFAQVGALLNDASDEYSAKQFEVVRRVAYRFAEALFKPATPLNLGSVSSSHFYDSKDLNDKERLTFLNSLRLSEQDCDVDLKQVHDFVSRHTNKYIIKLCSISLFFGIKADDSLFVQLLETLPPFIMFSVYHTLVSGFRDTSVKQQVFMAIYIDYFALRLQNMEIEEVKRSRSIISDHDTKATADIFESKQESNHQANSQDKTSVEPITLKLDSSIQCIPSSRDPFVTAENSQLSVKDIENKHDTQSASSDSAFMPLDVLKKLPSGSRVDFLHNDVWRNAQVLRTTSNDIIVEFLYLDVTFTVEFRRQFENRFAHPGTMATDHFYDPISNCILYLLNHRSHVVPNIIHCTPNLNQVFEGRMCHISFDSKHLALDVMNTALSKNVHKQVSVQFRKHYLFSGCIEKVQFKNDTYYYIIGMDIEKHKYCIPLSKNSESFTLPQEVEITTPSHKALFTCYHSF